MKRMFWFMDCYSYGAVLGAEFPVNSYKSYSLYHIGQKAAKLLERKDSGIDEIRIVKESKGQCPIFLED